MLSDLQNGTQLGHYRIERVIGRGGMGVVYLARDLGLDRYVALKILAPELAESETFRERFIRESRLAASLDHANIVPIYEADEVGGVLFIAMRYVQGNDLRAILREEERLEPYRAIAQIGTQVARALDAAHVRGLVHRDVKPGNVLVTSGDGSEGPGQCYLADFGLTRQTSALSSLTRAGQFVGTLAYIAPEQIQDRGVDGRSDQYALAAVLFECLAGRPPFVKDNDAAMIYAHLEEPPPRLSAIGWELPTSLDPVFARALAKEKQDRFDSCGQLIAAAREAAGVGAPSGQHVLPDRPLGDRTTVTGARPGDGAASATGTPPSPTPSGQWRRRRAARNPATWWTVAVAVLLVTALALFVFRGGGGAPSRGLGGTSPGSFLYTLDTGVGTGGVAGSPQRGEGIKGSVTSPGWEYAGTLAFVERTGARTDIEVATLGNKGKVRGFHSILTLSGSLSHLTWAPDGKRLVFVRTTLGHSVIQAVGRTGGGLQSLADPALGARDPAFAPNDGRSIAYEASSGGPLQIWAMSQNGGNPRPLTDRPGDCSNPTWSPDGQLIAFVGRVGDVNQLFVMSRNGQRQRQLTHLRAGLSDPAWSRDARRIYFVQNLSTGGSRLAAIDVKTESLKVLTEPMTAMSQAIVAPEGDIVFFVAQQAGVQQLFELRLGGGHPLATTDLAGGAYQPALSPDGATMAFVSRSAPPPSPSPSSPAPAPTSP